MQAAPSRLLSDRSLALRAAAGNQRALEAIFERYHQDLYRYCAAILGNAEDAHDAVQNTMLKVLRALPGEKREVKLKPWLYRIAHNEAIDMLRTRKGTEPIDAESLVGRSGPASVVEARERLRLLVADIADLPARQRGALVMREMGGLSYEQIGEALQTSAAVARQTTYEARVSLGQMSEGREMPCHEVMRAVSDEDGRTLRRRDIRAHLSHCESCQAFRLEISQRRRELAALAPLPAAASAGILQSLVGGAAGGANAAAGAVGAGAGKALGGTAAVKTAAAICAVATIGVVAADEGRVIGLGDGRGHPDPPARATSGPAQLPGAAEPARVGGIRGSSAVRAAKAQRRADGRKLSRAAAVALSSRQESAAASPTAGDRPETASESNGRHLGRSKEHAQAPARGKADHPAKGKKGSPPGQDKSPAQANHGGSAKKNGGRKQPETDPAPPAHPEHPDHPRAPDAEGSPPATDPVATPPPDNSPQDKTPSE